LIKAAIKGGSVVSHLVSTEMLSNMVRTADSQLDLKGVLIRGMQGRTPSPEPVETMDAAGWKTYLDARCGGPEWLRWYGNNSGNRYNVVVYKRRPDHADATRLIDLGSPPSETAQPAVTSDDSSKPDAQPTPPQVPEPKAASKLARVMSVDYTFDDAIMRAQTDSATALFPSDKVRLGDLAVQLAGIKSGKHDINAKDRNGWTALTAAARFGHTETVKLLISSGARVNAKDLRGETVLMRASKPEIKELLKAHGAKE
jgi:ankyrin repeat protein